VRPETYRLSRNGRYFGGMKVLLMGGTGFIGPAVVRQLQKHGHVVAVFHRGTSSAVEEQVERIIGDRRNVADYRTDFQRFAPDVVVDLILSSGKQAEVLMDTFVGIVERVVAISSMDVYRAAGLLHGSEPGPIEPLPLTEESPLRTTNQSYPPAT
jgi:nucleoside-diphosphate-sugar epimerase